MPDPTPPTPRAVLAQQAADAIYAYVSQVRRLVPRSDFDVPLLSDLRQKMVAAIRADERAALAASAGPLGIDAAVRAAWERLRVVYGCTDDEEVAESARFNLLSLREAIEAAAPVLLTAYTALAAENQWLATELEKAGDANGRLASWNVANSEKLQKKLAQAESDLAALRATVGLTLGELRQANVDRNAHWDSEGKLTLAFRGCELAGEVGEVCNVVKKIERERLGLRGSRDNAEHLAEELADVVICADLIGMAANVNLSKAVTEKFNATSEKLGLPVFLARTPTPEGQG